MRGNLVIDIGNHSMKAYVFVDSKITQHETYEGHDWRLLEPFIAAASYDACIVSTVVRLDVAFTAFLARCEIIIFLSASTPMPMKLEYVTRETLGPDRLAAALGGWQLSGEGNVLVIVAGTCITYNLIDSSGTFRGGAISPGLHMRLRAMHEFTGKLPMVSAEGEYPLIGNSTETSMRSGARNGMIQETKGMIEACKTQYPALKVIVSGGDGGFLAEALKNGIFARPDLVAEGLNTILNYNVANRPGQ
ncbi:MAG TPA: type III pantothenate kinase [Bacteroidia bacterium]|nr:type III pantothenate kinase [Bacteroidia bacterium]